MTTPMMTDRCSAMALALGGTLAMADVNPRDYGATGDGVTRDLEQAGQLFDLAEYMGVDVAGLREAVGLHPAPDDTP